MTNTQIRVLCVDDHRIVREGIGLIMSWEPDITIVGAAATGEEALTLFQQHRPDVTLMDLQLPTMSGLETIQAIRRLQPDARIIVLTVYQGNEDIHRAMEAGATAYLLKDTLSDDLITFVREVHAGRRPVGAAIKSRLDERAAQPTLTPREIQVIELVFEGKRNRDIAAALGISEVTVQVHVKNIFTKLKVSDRTAAVNVALRRGIIHVQDGGRG